jgi:hypothetical protein
MKTKWIFTLLVLMLAGCTFPAGTDVVSPQCPTQLPAPGCSVSGFTPSPEPAAPTPANPYQVISTKVAAGPINFRNGPGTIFSVANTYGIGSVFQVYAKDPGDGWIFVRTSNDAFGWVDVRFVEQGLDLTKIPAIIPPNVYVIFGRLLDQNGLPAQFVQFAVVQGSGNDAPRTDAQTNKDGMFYAFLPSTVTGTWRVSFVAYGCGYAFTGNCDRSGTVVPESQNITLPQTDILQFTWNGN